MTHGKQILDSDKFFVIDPITREITYESDAKLVLVQFDHNSERFTFEIPRYIEDHDMSECNKVFIHYLNAGSGGKYTDVYEVEDLQISEEDDSFVICSWLISQNATRYIGTLNFVIQFMCKTDDVIDYSWHTTLFKNIKVLEGMNNTEGVVEQNSDVLTQWMFRLEEAAIHIDPTNAVNAVNAAKDDVMAEVNAAIEKLEPSKAVASVESSANEILSKIDTSMDRVHGSITLHSNKWSSNEQTVRIPGLIDNHGIFFTPVSREDRNEVDTIGLFVSAENEIATFYVDRTPTVDINLSYIMFGITPIAYDGSYRVANRESINSGATLVTDVELQAGHDYSLSMELKCSLDYNDIFKIWVQGAGISDDITNGGRDLFIGDFSENPGFFCHSFDFTAVEAGTFGLQICVTTSTRDFYVHNVILTDKTTDTIVYPSTFYEIPDGDEVSY